MLVGVKVAFKLWLIILKSRIKIEKSSFYKNCSKKSNLNFLFHNLSSQMKGWRDNKAVRFEFEFTSYVYFILFQIMNTIWSAYDLSTSVFPLVNVHLSILLVLFLSKEQRGTVGTWLQKQKGEPGGNGRQPLASWSEIGYWWPTRVNPLLGVEWPMHSLMAVAPEEKGAVSFRSGPGAAGTSTINAKRSSSCRHLGPE
jgi:hypothetical protein